MSLLSLLLLVTVSSFLYSCVGSLLDQVTNVRILDEADIHFCVRILQYMIYIFADANESSEDMEMYDRNRIYVSPSEQEKIRSTRIFLGGAGIGSNIAECALRFGFERIVIVDGDKVECSNLNRQNYVSADVGRYKAECLAERLLAINPRADISFSNVFITGDNAGELLEGADIAVNALDFKSDIPFEFDRICSRAGIPVLHPYNFGWAGFLTIVRPGGPQLTELSEDWRGFELAMARHVVRCGQFWNIPVRWLDNVIGRYAGEGGPAPQLSVASWITAGHCVNAMFDLATGREVRYFPKFYIASFRDDDER